MVNKGTDKEVMEAGTVEEVSHPFPFSIFPLFFLS